MKSRRLIGLVAAAASAAMVAGCAGGTGAGGEEESGPIKIGFFAPMTGTGAADGRSAEAGATLAVDEINANGGIDGREIELIQYDDGSDPKQGAVIATKLTTQDEVVAAVSGSYSPQTLAAASIFQRAEVPLMSAYAVNPGIPETGEYIFQSDFNGVVQGRAGAQVLFDEGVKNPAIIAIDNDFGNSLVEGFTSHAEELGMSVVSADRNQFGEKNFDPIIRDVLDSDADAVYLVQYVAEGTQFIKSWNRADTDLPLLSTEGIDSASFITSAGEAAEGMEFTTNLNRDSDLESTQTFLTAYSEAYDFPPDMVAASSHDAIMLLAEAMRQGEVSSSGIQAGLYELSDFAGATGTIKSFNEIGMVVKPVQVQVFKDGEIHSVGVVDDPSIIEP